MQEVLNRGRDAALIALIDHPPVLPITVQKLRDSFLEPGRDLWAVIPEVSRGGQAVHGHPILVRREMIEAFLRAPADATAREIEHQYQQHIQYLLVEDARIAADIDTPEDYERLSASDLLSSEKQF
jgi:CTP:molybdopterin cytidylyltransferase MocA